MDFAEWARWVTIEMTHTCYPLCTLPAPLMPLDCYNKAFSMFLSLVMVCICGLESHSDHVDTIDGPDQRIDIKSHNTQTYWPQGISRSYVDSIVDE